MRWKQHPQAGLFSKDPTSDQESAGISFSKWDLFHYPTAAFQLLQSISFLASLKKTKQKNPGFEASKYGLLHWSV